MRNTLEVGLVLTVLNQLHHFPWGLWPRSREDRRGATYFVPQSKLGWPISPRWLLVGAAFWGGDMLPCDLAVDRPGCVC